MGNRSSSDLPRTDAIVSWQRGRKEEMAAFLAELVAIPTENPPGKHYQDCADFLETRLRQLRLDCERLAPSDSRNQIDNVPVCLLTRFGGGDEPNEYVDLRKVIDCASIYALTAVNVLNR
jgi:succinyl-diaminopimelate desuccinylase